MNLVDLCQEIQKQQRKRAILLKSRNMQANRLQAIVAGTLGYSSTMEEKDRAKKFAEATAVIESVVEEERRHELEDIIKVTFQGIEAFNSHKEKVEKAMRELAAQLPVATWVSKVNQRGFGLLFLAVVIGETGNLSNYANPAKVWRRLGCAPWSFDGKTQMGATWRSGKFGKLPAPEWEKFGYSPRRRSIAYLIGENIVKLNKGEYRARYDATKAIFKAKNPDYTDLRCHRHGMLLATKLFLKNLWIEWHKKS